MRRGLEFVIYYIWDTNQFSLVQFSRSVLSNSLRTHGLQHARPPCPSPTPRDYPNSCPLSQWCHPTISSSVNPFSSCLQSFPASGSFSRSQFFTSGGQSTGVSASTSVLPMNTQDWSPLGWTGWISLQSKGRSKVFCNTIVQNHQFFSAQLSLREGNGNPTPVLSPGKSYGQRSLVGCSPCGRTELDATEQLHFHFSFHALEKEMATHSSVLAWRIPGTGEPGGLPPMGSHRVGHDWSDLAAAAAAAFFIVQLSHPYTPTGKTIALTRWPLLAK